jgi:hypothetical protein
MKLEPDDLKNFIDDLHAVGKAHRAVIDDDYRLSTPFHEVERAARVKLERISEGRVDQRRREDRE